MARPHYSDSEDNLAGSLFGEPWASLIRENYIFIAILGLAIFIRLLGTPYGLVGQFNATEKLIIDPVMQTLKNGALAEDMSGFSPLAKWINLAIVAVVYIFGSLLGRINPALPISDPALLPVFHLWACLFNITLAVISLWVAYLLAKAIYGQLAGLIAMLLIAFLPLHVENSLFINADIPATLFGLTALYMMVQAQQKQQLKYLVFAGIFSGLAIATQMWMGLVVIGFIGLFIIRFLDKSSQHLRGRIWIGWVSFIAAYLFVNPIPLLNLPKFFTAIGKDAFYLSGIAGLTNNWFSRISSVFIGQVGIILCIALCLGLLGAFFRINHFSILLFSIIVVYAIFTFQYAVNLPGLLLPVVCIALVLTAGLINNVLARIIRHQDTFLLPYMGVVMILLVGEMVVRSGIGIFSYSQPATGSLASNYVQTYIPRFYKIAMEEGAPSLPGYDTMIEPAIGYNHPFQWYVDNQYAFIILVGDKANEYSDPKYGRLRLFAASIKENGTLLQEVTPSLVRSGPQIRIYKILPVVLTGQELYSEDLLTGLSPDWKVTGGKWRADQGKIAATGTAAPKNMVGDLVDVDKNGIPDGWQQNKSLPVQFINGEITLQPNLHNQFLISPQISLSTGDPESPGTYLLSLELFAQITSPSFLITLLYYDSSGKQLNDPLTLERFGVGSFDWQMKTYPIKTSDIPAGALGLRVMFLVNNSSSVPQMVIKIRNISMLPAQSTNMAFLSREDALRWDKYIYQTDITFIGPNGKAGVSFYQQDENNYYLLEVDKDKKKAYLSVVQNNAQWVLAERPFDAGYSTSNINIDLSTAEMVVFINQQEFFHLTDTTFSSGTVGRWMAPSTRVNFGKISLVYGGR